MKRRTLKIVITLVAVLLALELGFVFWMRRQETRLSAPPVTEPPVLTQTVPTVPVMATELPETVPTEAPTTEPETLPPEPEHFLLTFAGDCTLASDPEHYGVRYSLIDTVGEDYGYPFRNVVSCFENDDFTIVNLECVLTESTSQRDYNSLFTFRGPVAYTQILTGSSVEAVTLANNHTDDYGKQGYESTVNALTEANISFVEKDGSALYTTDSGLTIGLYAASFKIDIADLKQEVAALRDSGAEIVIAAFHWGKEGSYRPTQDQKSYAHQAIDAGVDIVYGSHPHVLQPVEEYGDGIIYYSMGNFSFGGNNYPRDLDSVILQQEVIRDPDGAITLGELTMIPCSISSLPVQNNFQPTPYEEGSTEYLRVMDKLTGDWKGADLVVDYNNA